MSARFDRSVIEALDAGQRVGLRAGSGRHRFIGLWPVVVEGRLFVRSWGRKPGGWHAVLLADPVGTIEVAKRRLRVRAVQTRSERLKRAVDAEYRRKFDKPYARHYVRGLCGAACRATTTELVPADPPATGGRRRVR